MISVIILTKNESSDLPSCLDALTWCDDIHVLDSGSTDNTLEIASGYSANIVYNKFESFGQQRNFALDNIRTKYEWILFLDADEVSTIAFKNSILNLVGIATDDVAGYYCCWKMMLGNTWLKYSDNFPKWQFRLLRKGMARFTDFGHGQKEDLITGRILYVKEPYIHHGFSKGWTHWIEKHNKYSSQEAYARLAAKPSFNSILSKHSSVRNPALKSFLSKIPGWPMLRFFQAYLLAGGFLEGSAGFIYSANMAYYEFLIQIKIREINQKRK